MIRYLDFEDALPKEYYLDPGLAMALIKTVWDEWSTSVHAPGVPAGE